MRDLYRNLATTLELLRFGAALVLSTVYVRGAESDNVADWGERVGP